MAATKKVLQAKLQYAFSDALGWGQNYSDFLQKKKNIFKSQISSHFSYARKRKKKSFQSHFLQIPTLACTFESTYLHFIILFYVLS